MNHLDLAKKFKKQLACCTTDKADLQALVTVYREQLEECNAIVEQDAQVTMKLNGENFTADRNLSAISNANISGFDTVIMPNGVAIIRFEIPAFNGLDIFDEYVFPVTDNITSVWAQATGGVAFAGTDQFQGHWVVQIDLDLTGTASYDFDIVANDFILFSNGSENSSFSDGFGSELHVYGDDFNSNYTTAVPSTAPFRKYLRRDTTYFMTIENGDYGVFHITQFDVDDNILQEDHGIATDFVDLIPFSADVTKILVQKELITKINNCLKGIYLSGGRLEPCGVQQIPPSTTVTYGTKHDTATLYYSLGTNNPAHTYDIELWKQGVLIHTYAGVAFDNGNSLGQVSLIGFKDYDQIIVNETP